MKILTVIENVDEKTGGGAAERARQISLKLSSSGHNVTLLTTKCYLSELTVENLKNIELICLPCLNKRFYIPLPKILLINKLIRNSDVIQMFSHWTLINALVFFISVLNKKPYIINPLGATPVFGRSALLKKLFNLVVGKRIIKSASKCVVATREESRSLESLGVKKENILHIPNGVNEEDYKQKGNKDFRINLNISNPFILFIGRLNPIKGPDLLLKAFCSIKDDFKNLDLVYIGPNEGMFFELEELAIKESVEKRVHFLGYVSKEDKSRIIDSSLFLTVPSRQEAMSIVVLESGISGKPVLITDQCGFNEVEEDMHGGIVVQPSLEGLASGITKMLENRDRLNSMGENLRKNIRKRYLWSILAEEYTSLFNEIKLKQV